MCNRLDQHDIQRVSNIHDAKQIIDTYQLWKSQLVFTIAERVSGYRLPVPMPHTSVASQVMCDEASGRRSSFDEIVLINPIVFVSVHLEEPILPNLTCSSSLDDESVICTPRKGAWVGRDDILMVIPKLDRRKGKGEKN